MTEVKNQLKHTTYKLEVKEEQELTKYKKNVEMLNKLMAEKNVLLENLKKVSQRVKELENKSQKVPCPTPVQLQSSTKGKRDNSDLSSA